MRLKVTLMGEQRNLILGGHDSSCEQCFKKKKNTLKKYLKHYSNEIVQKCTLKTQFKYSGDFSTSQGEGSHTYRHFWCNLD